MPPDTPIAPSLEQLTWLNPPRQWSTGGGSVELVTDAGTDFWRTTHYGFVRDNGHLLWQPAGADFAARVDVRGRYRDQYDQAGLMVRLDARQWVKCGIELADGAFMMSTVVTRDVSDWSVTRLESAPDTLGLRVTRNGDTLTVEFSLDGAGWQTHRLAFFPPGAGVMVGPMAASPDGDGFEVGFTGLSVTPLPAAPPLSAGQP